jgi:Phytanoyl-CoA dioxygenase (PhyH)
MERMATSRLSTEQLSQITEDGYAVTSPGLDVQAIRELNSVLDTSHAGERNLLDVPVVRRLAGSSFVRGLIEPVLGSGCFAVRGILFNKTKEANWKVVWHQDCVIAVVARKDLPGWRPWSIKAGVNHVRPSSDIPSRMLAIRIHLDECGAENGPLRVIPGSHKQGFLSDRLIQDWMKSGAVTCIASQGHAILMRPLLLHSSSPATVPGRRRVIHLEFAAEELPNGVEWKDRV